jgi:uncharacterized protein with GYD domain
MATYILLCNFTDQGIRAVSDTTKRSDAIQERASRYGITLKDVCWTLGSYDVVVTVDAPDDASMTAFGLALGSAGNVRTQTLRAFTRKEMDGILARAF